jgi:hypothetical protein
MVGRLQVPAALIGTGRRPAHFGSPRTLARKSAQQQPALLNEHVRNEKSSLITSKDRVHGELTDCGVQFQNGQPSGMGPQT